MAGASKHTGKLWFSAAALFSFSVLLSSLGEQLFSLWFVHSDITETIVSVIHFAVLQSMVSDSALPVSHNQWFVKSGVIFLSHGLV